MYESGLQNVENDWKSSHLVDWYPVYEPTLFRKMTENAVYYNTRM